MRVRLLTLALLMALPATASAAGGERKRYLESLERDQASFDVRDTTAGRRRALPRGSRRRAAQLRLKRSLGRTARVRIDPLTGAPRSVARLAGYLTGRRRGSAGAVALSYLRTQAGAFGLDADDRARLRLVKRHTSRRGFTHLLFVQTSRGVPAFDSGVRVNLKGGRVVNLAGSLQPDLELASARPRLTAEAAARRARLVVPGGDELAGLVAFGEGSRTRLAWNLVGAAGPDQVHRVVVDASSGAILKRASLLRRAGGLVHLNFPGATVGGAQTSRPFSTSGADPWVGGGFTRLAGDNARAYSDQADDTHFNCGLVSCTDLGEPAASQEVAPSAGSGSAGADWGYAQADETNNASAFPQRSCPTAGCTWNGFSVTNPNTIFTAGDNWQRNRAQGATQAFFFVNNFHDHTQNDAGIAFSDADGNFEESASAGVGGDPVHAQTHDGAATGSGGDFPNNAHKNNASMLTLPEQDVSGPVDYPFRAPRMELFLFTANGSGAGINDVHVADDAGVVYHEYSHGVFERLVNPLGSGDTGSTQAGALNEATADWLAADYLHSPVSGSLESDASGAPDVGLGSYLGLDLRTQPFDCPVTDRSEPAPGPQVPGCPGGNADYFGGYTYGDFGTICCGGPEVHADGEIWVETLWDLRRSLVAAHGAGNGSLRARALVSDAMRLSSANPDYLEMRDMLLQANTANGFGDCARIWAAFAGRGMGAGATSPGPAGDPEPGDESFTNPSASACPSSGSGGGGSGGGSTGGGATGGSSGGGAGESGGGPAAPAKADLSGARRSVRVSRRGVFVYRFRATPGLRGRLVIRSRGRVRVSRRRRVTLVNRVFRVPDSGRVRLRIRLRRRARRILRLNRRIRATAKVRLRNSAGLTSTAARRLTLRAPRRRR